MCRRHRSLLLVVEIKCSTEATTTPKNHFLRWPLKPNGSFHVTLSGFIEQRPRTQTAGFRFHGGERPL